MRGTRRRTGPPSIPLGEVAGLGSIQRVGRNSGVSDSTLAKIHVLPQWTILYRVGLSLVILDMVCYHAEQFDADDVRQAP
jgi:hypothetical protein